VDQNIERDQRIMWAFLIAAGLAVIGALAPFAFSVGAHSRLSGAAIPFGFAAVAFVVAALMHQQGRTVAVALYFVAGLAIVYGILAMLAVPLRLAVVGTCPAAPAHCPTGFEPPLTSGENSALGTATFCGILAIFIGFYGLVMLYRRARTARTQSQAHAWPAAPPVQPAPTPDAVSAPAEPAPAKPMEPTPVAIAETDPVPAPAPPPKPARRAAAKKASPAPKPPPDEELKELPAPEELKELPPPA
jgi:hypothetical protein